MPITKIKQNCSRTNFKFAIKLWEIIESNKNQLAIQRLTALWALAESGLGGLLHAIKLPFTGLIIGSIAILIISLISHYSKNDWKTMMGALLLVLIIKITVSPHAQITAFIAVGFQGVFGYLCYRLLPFQLAAFVFSIVALLESAFQKIIVLTLLFGSELWEAIDTTGEWVIQKMNPLFEVSSSQLLIGIYGGIYFIGAILLGALILQLTPYLENKNPQDIPEIIIPTSAVKQNSKNSTSKKFRKHLILILAFAAVMIFGFMQGTESGWYLLIRTLFFLAIYFIIVAPILLHLLKNFLSKKQQKLGEELAHIFDLIPYLRTIISLAWKEAAQFSWLRRWKEFFFRTILYALYFKKEG